MLHKEGRKSGPARHICVGDSERQGKGEIEVNEELVMLGSRPGSCPPYFALSSLLFEEVKVARQFPPRINLCESLPWIIWRQTKQARNQGTKDHLWRTPQLMIKGVQEGV